MDPQDLLSEPEVTEFQEVVAKPSATRSRTLSEYLKYQEESTAADEMLTY